MNQCRAFVFLNKSIHPYVTISTPQNITQRDIHHESTFAFTPAVPCTSYVGQDVSPKPNGYSA